MWVATARSCPACKKRMKSFSGATRHQLACKRLKARQRELRALRSSPTIPESTSSKPFVPLTEGNLYYLNPPSTSNESAPTLAEPTAVGHCPDAQILPSESDGSPHINEDTEAPCETEGHPVAPSARLSTASTSYTRTFKEETGMDAGRVYEDSNPNCGHDQKGNNPWHPFNSRLEFGLALFFLQRCLTKGDIDDFLKSTWLNEITDQLTFKSADHVFELIDSIRRADCQWKRTNVVVGSDIRGVESQKYSLRFDAVDGVVEDMLGDTSLQEHTVYAPVRQYTADGQRVYTEMHTADWWWNIQTKLPPGATVVPILIATDKTQLTQHRGDQVGWPVYMTLGNLTHAARRSQKLNGTRLVGMMPAIKDVDRPVRLQAYHDMMRIIFKPLEALGNTGVMIRCSDGKIRQCFPIITGMMVDYEEQTLITGVKSGRHCTICQVEPKERENLLKTWPKRTHELTMEQLLKQKRIENGELTVKPDEFPEQMWVHNHINFAWYHAHLNIHEGMMMDLLHQLLKGCMHYLIDWLKHLVKDVCKTTSRRNDESIVYASGVRRLDERFRNVAPYPSLTTFQSFSNVTQWTGEDQKAVARQLVLVVAPILTKSHPAAVLYTRAMCDFWMIAQYRSHNDDTIQYLEHALFCIDKLKWVFSQYRTNKKDPSERGHFNIPKFHAITHYPEFIRSHGTLDGVDTSHSEAAHSYAMKEPFKRTNRRDGYEDQIASHYSRRLRMSSLANTMYHSITGTQHALVVEEELEAKVVAASRAATLKELGWTSHVIRDRCQRNPTRLTAAELASVLKGDGEDFTTALAVFVREMRKRATHTEDGMNIVVDTDCAWVDNYEVEVHRSLVTWKPDGKNGARQDALVREVLRCSPQWQGKKDNWRRDYVWIQDRHASNRSNRTRTILDGKIVAQLLVIISVHDKAVRSERVGMSGIATTKEVCYQGAFVKTMRPRTGRPHEVHGLVEVEPHPPSNVGSNARRRNLGGQRIYPLDSILRGAHVSPGEPQDSGKELYYINNYIDWDQYNTLYDPDFLAAGKRQVHRWSMRLYNEAMAFFQDAGDESSETES